MSGSLNIKDASKKETIHLNKAVYLGEDFKLPDVLSHLQNETNLTRKTLVAILIQCGKLQDFKTNPQKFMDEATRIIRLQMSHFIGQY